MDYQLKENERFISLETQQKWVEFKAHESLVDKYIKVSFFAHKRVVFHQKKAKECELAFWQMVFAEHPDLRHENVRYETRVPLVEITTKR